MGTINLLSSNPLRVVSCLPSKCTLILTMIRQSSMVKCVDISFRDSIGWSLCITMALMVFLQMKWHAKVLFSISACLTVLFRVLAKPFKPFHSWLISNITEISLGLTWLLYPSLHFKTGTVNSNNGLRISALPC